jgi:hypothetical protein
MALAALRSDKPLTEIAQHYEVYPNQVTEWKRQLLERAADVFEGGQCGQGRQRAGPQDRLVELFIMAAIDSIPVNLPGWHFPDCTYDVYPLRPENISRCPYPSISCW